MADEHAAGLRAGADALRQSADRLDRQREQWGRLPALREVPAILGMLAREIATTQHVIANMLEADAEHLDGFVELTETGIGRVALPSIETSPLNVHVDVAELLRDLTFDEVLDKVDALRALLSPTPDTPESISGDR